VEEHDGVTSLVAAVEAGRGLALVPGSLSCMVGPRLKLIPLRELKNEVVVGAAWKPEKFSPVAEKFILLAQAAREDIAPA
jgi:DNA-binding transcriptional LysR family regulator